MKRTNIFTYCLLPFSLLLLISTTACNPELISPKASSELCTGISGAEAVYWDIRNGIARGDLPGGVPVIDNPGGTYGHPGFPLLGFQYPAGWTPETLSDPASQMIGVNLLRNDNLAIYRYISYSVPGFVTVQEVLDFEYNQMINFFGIQGTVQTICENQGTSNTGGTLFMEGKNILVRGDGQSAMLNVSVTYVDGLPSTFISAQLTAGPTIEHNQLIEEVFLPIHWQLLIRPEDTVLSDRDGDGVADVYDSAPDDPTKW